MTTETRFVGSIPAIYDRHLGPVLFEPYAIDLAQRLPHSARRVLEVAAGTGRVTRHLLRALPPDAQLIATDLNEPMIAVGQQVTGTDPRVTWQVADAQSLPFPDGAVDAVVCQFGLMFMPDKVRALREMKRVLGAAGILLLSTWDDLSRNPVTQLLHELVTSLFPGNPPDFMKVPFSLPDPHELERLATEAGYRGIRVETVTKQGVAESASHLAHGCVRGNNPLVHQIAERGLDPAVVEAQVATALGRAFGDKPCQSQLSAHVVTAFA